MKALIFDLKKREHYKFIWSEDKRKSFIITCKALRKAERENKIRIVYIDEVNE